MPKKDVKIPKWWKEWMTERPPWEIIEPGDPAPFDVIRRRILEGLIRSTQPDREAASDLSFSKVLEAVPRMAAEELKRAHSAVKTSISLGESVLAAIEGRIRGR